MTKVAIATSVMQAFNKAEGAIYTWYSDSRLICTPISRDAGGRITFHSDVVLRWQVWNDRDWLRPIIMQPDLLPPDLRASVEKFLQK